MITRLERSLTNVILRETLTRGSLISTRQPLISLFSNFYRATKKTESLTFNDSLTRLHQNSTEFIDQLEQSWDLENSQAVLMLQRSRFIWSASIKDAKKLSSLVDFKSDSSFVVLLKRKPYWTTNENHRKMSNCYVISQLMLSAITAANTSVM